MTDEERDQRRRLYEQLSLKYQDEANKSIQEFDRAILTLSSGTLGLSLAFIKDVVHLEQAKYLNLLFFSWGMLGLAILLTLGSFILSQTAFKQMQSIAFEYYIELKEEARERQKRHWPSRLTRAFTYLAGACFVSALALTLVFAVANVRDYNREPAILDKIGGRKMGYETTQGVVPVKKGTDPPMVIQVPPPAPLVIPPTQAPTQTK